MKELLGVLLAAALLIGVSAAAVESLGDRDLFVPPPEAVAEGFTRELMTKRWSRAKQYLADPQSTSDEELEARQRSIEARVGEPTGIEAEELDRDGDRARVDVRLSSARGSETVTWQVVFDDEWKVAE